MTEDIRGFSIPFRIDPATGGVAQESGPDKLRQNIIHLLLTDNGERVMNRSYGGGLRQLVHDPNNDALRAIVQHQIAKAIGEHEPRVLLQGVTIRQQDGTLIADVQYVVRRTREVQSVSVPLGLGGV